MNLNDWFDKGMTLDQYIEGMKVNREEMLRIHEQFHLTEEQRSFAAKLADKNLRVIVLTADWCGDAMLCIPILMRIAEVGKMELRFLIRDDNLELMDQYLTNGKSRSIPIFIFIDEEGTEQAVWGPRAPEVQQFIENLRSTLPPKEDPTFEEKQKEMYRQFKKEITSNPERWTQVYNSIEDRLSKLVG